MSTCLFQAAVLSALALAAAQGGPPPVGAGDPLAGLARLVGGEWRMGAAGGAGPAPGEGPVDTWQWGPGRHSLRVTTVGTGGNGQPWRKLGVVYRHPGREEVRLLELSAFAAGVAEGTVRSAGEAVEADFAMFQTGVRRRLRSRRTFQGPDRYREDLLESTGGEYQPLASWDWQRAATPPAPRPVGVAGATLPATLKAFGPLLNRTWEADLGAGAVWGGRVVSTFEWVPLANGVYVRTEGPGGGAGPRHLLDAYVYHHTGAGVLRCLALTARGGVYEGDVTAVEGGPLRFDLKGDEGGRAVRYELRFDPEPGGALRQRVWSAQGPERSPVLDVRHTSAAPPATRTR